MGKTKTTMKLLLLLLPQFLLTSAFHQRSSGGIRARLPQIEVAVADNATALVFRVLDPPTDADLERLKNFGNDHDLRVLLQSKGPDSVEALEAELPPLHYRLDEYDVRLEFEGTDFVQVNGRVNERMVSTALSLLDAQDSDTVLDLYCGIGNFSLPLARVAGRVIGIEGEERQVLRARHNASLNGIENIEFVAAPRRDLALRGAPETATRICQSRGLRF